MLYQFSPIERGISPMEWGVGWGMIILEEQKEEFWDGGAPLFRSSRCEAIIHRI